MVESYAPEMRVFAPEPIPITIDRTARAGLRLLAALAIAIPIVIAFLQYIESVVEARINRADDAFTNAVTTLASPSVAIQAEALRELHRVSFHPSPPPPGTGAAAMAGVLRNWALNRTEHQHLERGRAILQNFLRQQETSEPGILPQTIGQVAADWIDREREIGTDLSDFHFLLSAAQLTYTDLSSRDLSQLNISETNLSYSTLNRTDLRRSALISSTLRSAWLISAQAEDADFQRAIIEDSDLSFIACDHCNFQLAQISESHFDGADLTGAVFDQAHIIDVNFRSASLVGARFRRAVLRRSDFSNADLYNADFTGADLSNSDLRFARNLNYVSSWCGAMLPSRGRLPARFSRRTSC